MSDVQIGTVLYHKDTNCRTYVHEDGTKSHAPIYEKFFAPRTVVSETRVSWVLDNGMKVNKKDLSCIRAYDFGGQGIFTEAQMHDDIWRHNNRLRIIRAVEDMSVDDLRKVDAILQARP